MSAKMPNRLAFLKEKINKLLVEEKKEEFFTLKTADQGANKTLSSSTSSWFQEKFNRRLDFSGKILKGQEWANFVWRIQITTAIQARGLISVVCLCFEVREKRERFQCNYEAEKDPCICCNAHQSKWIVQKRWNLH
jgi:hypothetical protein